MISLKQRRHLTVIAEQTNMHKAAEILHITQPALTRSLNTLEGLLNVRLFDRHSGGMRATPFCTEIVDKCQQILLDVEDIQRAARLLHDVEEVLFIDFRLFHCTSGRCYFYLLTKL